MNRFYSFTLTIYFIISNTIKCRGEEMGLDMSLVNILTIAAIQAISDMDLLKDPDALKSESWIYFRNIPDILVEFWCIFIDHTSKGIRYHRAEQYIEMILASVKSQYDHILPARSNFHNKVLFYSNIYLLLQKISCEYSLDLLLIAEASDVGIYSTKEPIIILIASICSSVDLKQYIMKEKIAIFFGNTNIRDKILVHCGTKVINFVMELHDVLGIGDSIPRPSLNILSRQDPEFLSSIEPRLVFDLTPESDYEFLKLTCNVMIEMYNFKVKPKNIFEVLTYILWRSLIITQSVLILEIIKLLIEISRKLHIGIESFLNYADYQDKVITKLRDKFNVNLQIGSSINDCKQSYSGEKIKLLPRPSTDIQQRARLKLKKRRKSTSL